MIAIQPQSRQLLGVNQQAYQALKASMSLDLRRQLLIAVCDNVVLQDQLAAQLERDLAKGTVTPTDGPANGATANAPSPGIERLLFDAEDGNLPQQVAQWVRHTMLSEGSLPKVQVLGIEQMTRQPAIAQNYFLRSLEKIEALLPRLNTSLLIWVPWPWLRTIQQSAPTFWNWRNGVYEFVSDPTPTPDRDEPLRLEFPDTLGTSEHSDSENSSGRERLSRSSRQLLSANYHNAQGQDQQEHGDQPRKAPMADDATTVQSRDSAYPAIASLYGESASDAFESADPGRAADLSEVADFLEEIESSIKTKSVTAESADATIDIANDSLQEVPFDLFDDGLDTDNIDIQSLEAPGELESSILTADSAEAAPSVRHLPSLGGLQSTVSQGANVPLSIDEQLPDIEDDVDDLLPELDGLEDSTGDSTADLDADDWAADDWDSDSWDQADSDSERADDIDDSEHVEAAFASLDWNEFGQSSDNSSDSSGSSSNDALADPLAVEVSEDTLLAVLSDEEIPVNHLRLDQLNLAPSEVEMSEPKMPEMGSIAQSVPLSSTSFESSTESTQSEQPTAQATRLKVGDQRNLKAATGVQVVAVPQPPQAAQSAAQPAQLQNTQALAAEHFTTGLTYRKQIESGDRTLETIEAAITAYRNGLDCLEPPHADRITALNDLGTLYWLKAQQQKDPQQAAAFMHESIELYQRALTESDSPQVAQEAQGSSLQNAIIGQLYSNTGAVYTMLATCEDPLENLTQAAKTYCQAIPLMSLAKEPEEYATLQNSLGSVFWKLSHYDSAETYLQQAITAYNEALLGYRPEQQPMDYAAVQNNLGITYWSLAKHERPEFLLKHAVAAYRDALNYRTSEADPAACAISYNNLALAYWDLSKHTQNDLAQKSRYQKNAVTAFEAALNISKLSGALSPMDSAAIYHCLGDVHAQMVETAPSLVEVGESLQKSLYSYIKATEDLPTDSPAYPGRFGAIVANLRLHYDKLGLEGQQSALNQVPATLLPQVMMTL